jgi:predicted nucleic acid-binding protein
LGNVTVSPLDEANAKAAGALCGRTNTNDPIDATVAITARRHHHTVITSDPDDIRGLDATLRIGRAHGSGV